MNNWLGQRVLEAMKFIADDLARSYADDLWTSFSTLFSSPVAVLQDPWIEFFIKLAVTIAMGCLPVLITYQAVRRMLESMDGSSTIPPEVLVRRSLVAGVAVTGVALYGWFAGTVADHLRELLGALPLQISFLEIFFLGNDPTSGLAGLLLLLIFLVSAALVVVQRAILSAEFSMLMIIGAFLALQKLSDDNPQAWQLWKREVVAICITPVLQLLLIFLVALRLGAGHASELGKWLEGFAMLYLLWNMPRWARQFTYSTGMGHAVAGAAAGATRMAVISMMLKKR